MTKDEFQTVLTEALTEHSASIDKKLEDFRGELQKNEAPVEGTEKSPAELIADAIAPLVEAVEGLNKDRNNFGEAVSKTLDRVENIEKALTGRQSAPDEAPEEPSAVKKDSGSEIRKAIGAALSQPGRKVEMR